MSAADDLVAAMREDHVLLLRAALLDGDPARAAFAAWRDAIDINLVDPPSQRLLPLLARRMPDLAPDDLLRGLVKGIYRHAWGTNHRLWRDALPALDGLGARGIPTLFLKGVALLDAYGGDWGARPMYDVDVLVPTERAVDAIECLDARGWVPEQGQTAAWVRWRALPRRHGWGFTRGDGKLDLHWHVLGESIGAHADDRFWARARTVEFAGTETRVLDRADLLVHLLVHGTVTQHASVIQWVADAVMVLRAEADDPTFATRVAATAREQGELASVARALVAVGVIVDPTVVASTLASVEAARPTTVDWLRRLPAGIQATHQWARHSAGGQGLVRGGIELVDERLDLSLTTRPRVARSYAASGWSRHVARAWRAQGGSFVRTAVDDPPPLTRGVTLDFTRAETLDRYGGPGWGRTEPGGATTRGGEGRLVFPLGSDLAGGDLLVVVELEANGARSEIVILANEAPVARATVTARGDEVRFVIPVELAARFTPLELALRNARVFPPSSVRVRLRRVVVDVATPDAP